MSRSQKSVLGTDCMSTDPVKIKAHLNNLFELVDGLICENIQLKERVDELEEIISETSMGGVQSMLDQSVKSATSNANQGPQKFSVSSVKRDSMVAASQLSQKIKSTYKLKTTSKIFKGQQNSSIGYLMKTYDWHKDGIWYITSCAKNGRQYIATASADGTVQIHDLTRFEPAQLVANYSGHQASVNCVKFHKTNDLMLSASGEGKAHIWRFAPKDADYGVEPVDEGMSLKSPLLELTGHQSVVISCDWASGIDQCVTASWDRNANIYDYHTGDLVFQLVGHDQELTDVSCHDSNRLIVTASQDTTFRLWDFRDPIHSVSVFQGHNRAVTSTAFVGNDKIISGGDDRNVKVWDLKNMRSPLLTISMESSINKLSVSKQHNLITIPLDNRNVRIYDINGNRICRLSRDSHSRMVTCATWINSDSPLTGSSNLATPSSTSGSGSTSAVSSSTTGTGSSTLPATLNLLTCAFDRRVCAWEIRTEVK